jgi:hypothetical protein
MAVESSQTAHLLAELTKNAAEFNRATDSINSLIEGFEETLRNLHLGIETWVRYPSLNRYDDTENYADGATVEVVVETQLGFTKRAGEWGLAVRTAVYTSDEGRLELSRVESEFPLRDASRELRIEALGQFARLLHDLNEKVKDVVQKIQAVQFYL